MFGYTAVRDKIGVQIRNVRAFSHWFSASVGVLLVSILGATITGSLLMWVAGLTVSVCAWLLDVSHRRLTFDSWRPHIVFWPTMAIVTLLSGGVAGIVTIPGYLLEKRVS